MVPSSHAEKDNGEESKDTRSRAAGRESEARPLDDFSKKIGSSYVIKQATDRDFVCSFSRFAQVYQ